MATFENMILIEHDSSFATAGVFTISNSLFVGSMGLCSHCVSIYMNSVLDQLPAFQKASVLLTSRTVLANSIRISSLGMRTVSSASS